jgi:hypothetical protein
MLACLENYPDFTAVLQDDDARSFVFREHTMGRTSLASADCAGFFGMVQRYA